MIDVQYIDGYEHYALINTIVVVIIFSFFKLYDSLWSFASVNEEVNIVMACIVAGAVQIIGMYFLRIEMPRSYYPISTVLLMMFVTIGRFLSICKSMASENEGRRCGRACKNNGYWRW